MNGPSLEKTTNIALLVMLLLASVAQNGTLFGKKHDEWFQADQPPAPTEAPSGIQLIEGGFRNAFTRQVESGVWDISDSGQTIGKVVATLEHNRKTFGFAGPVPMYLFLDQDDKIQHVTLRKNSEDPEFIDSALEKGFLTQWHGLTIQEAGVESFTVIAGQLTVYATFG